MKWGVALSELLASRQVVQSTEGHHRVPWSGRRAVEGVEARHVGQALMIQQRSLRVDPSPAHATFPLQPQSVALSTGRVNTKGPKCTTGVNILGRKYSKGEYFRLEVWPQVLQCG